MIRLGTRGSALAVAQSEQVADQLRAQGLDVELVIIRTEGDVNRQPLSQLGGIGVFAAALRTALLNGECDLAVHSFKDLPTAPVTGLKIAAVPKRASWADVLVTKDGCSLAELVPNAKVGTGSPRRWAQLLHVRPDLEIVDIRGNVDTRAGFVSSGKLDAVVLAEAGLSRLGRELPTSPLTELVPAAAQGALAIETRDETLDAQFAAALAKLDDAPTRAAVMAEREVLAFLQAGCAAPVGAHAQMQDQLTLRAVVASLDGKQLRTTSACGDDPIALGQKVAQQLLDAGAGDIANLQAKKEPRR